MSTASATNFLQQGITAAKAGNKPLARQYLLQALERYSDSEACWLWLAIVAESLEERAGYLQQVLALNPQNQRAAQALKQLQDKLAQEVPPAPAWHCPLCEAAAPEAANRCAVCGALLSVADPGAFFTNQGVDQAALHEAIHRLKGNTAHNGDRVTQFYYLGLAYLNLGQVDTASTFFQGVVRQQPQNTAVTQLLHHLQQRQAATAVATKKPSKGTIMVVDDSATICKLVSMTLQRQDYEVVVAVDGLDALAKLNEKMPDLILLDITMPRLDGYQVCKIVTGNNETAAIPVIMLSGKDGFFDKVRGRMAGATDYITKPFEPKELVKTVRRYLTLKQTS